MTIQDIGLFKAIGAKMDYLNQRQSVIAQNIANSDTPGYRPKDLVEVDFASMISPKSQGSGAMGNLSNVSIATTNEQHLSTNGQNSRDVKARKQKDTYEVAPSGNAVIMEEQLIDAEQNTMDYNLMINIYQKQVDLFRIALGR